MKDSGTEDLPDPTHNLKDKVAHKESPASRGPDSREHLRAKSSSDIDDSAAHSSSHSYAQNENPASRDPASREHSTATPQGLSNPSGKTEGTSSEGHHQPRHTSDHPPPSPSKPEKLHSVLTPAQRECIQTLIRSIRKRKTGTTPPQNQNQQQVVRPHLDLNLL